MQLAETALWLEHIFPGQKAHIEAGEVHLMIARLDDPNVNIVVTEDLSRADTGLVTDGKDLKVELMTLVDATNSTDTDFAIAALRTAAGLLLAGAGPIQPGLLLPQLQPGVHGICLAPFVWEQGTPRIEEETSVTAMLQLMLVNDEEFAAASEEGIEVLQHYFAVEGIDPNDLSRLR